MEKTLICILDPGVMEVASFLYQLPKMDLVAFGEALLDKLEVVELKIC